MALNLYLFCRFCFPLVEFKFSQQMYDDYIEHLKPFKLLSFRICEFATNKRKKKFSCVMWQHRIRAKWSCRVDGICNANATQLHEYFWHFIVISLREFNECTTEFLFRTDRHVKQWNYECVFYIIHWDDSVTESLKKERNSFCRSKSYYRWSSLAIFSKKEITFWPGFWLWWTIQFQCAHK